MKKKLLKAGYKRFEQPDGEPTLYQKKVCDKKGIKYFINCYHYIFQNLPESREGWEFKLQTESNFGTVNTTLFNTGKKTINQIEVFMECTWGNYGAKYYEEFAEVSNNEVSR